MLCYPHGWRSRLGPVGENLHNLSSGVEPWPFLATPPPSSQSPKTGATLALGQERTKEKTA